MVPNDVALARTNHIPSNRFRFLNRVCKLLRPDWQCARSTDLQECVRAEVYGFFCCRNGVGRLRNFDESNDVVGNETDGTGDAGVEAGAN